MEKECHYCNKQTKNFWESAGWIKFSGVKCFSIVGETDDDTRRYFYDAHGDDLVFCSKECLLKTLFF